MAEELDTQNPSPNDGSADSVGHDTGATQDTSQGVTEQPTTPSDEASPEAAEAPAPKYRYLGKKFADVHALEDGYLEAQRKITELAQKPQQPEYQQPDYTDTGVEQIDPAEQRIQSLQRQVAATNLRLAQAEEDKLLDMVVEAHPALDQARDLMKAFWRQNPSVPAETVVARFEKLVSLGRNESKGDLLKKKQNAVETGKGSTEAPTQPSKSGSAFERAADISAKSRQPDLNAWADAIPESLLK